MYFQGYVGIMTSRGGAPRWANAGPTLGLPAASSVLAVCAHPDDESFGLGAALAGFAESGAEVAVLSFTRGESSTLGATGFDALSAVRAHELRAAAQVLGVSRVVLLEHPDGGLHDIPLESLVADVRRVAGDCSPDILLVFDTSGVTGHADHCRATEAAVVAAHALELPVLAWGITRIVAEQLNAELGTEFSGRDAEEFDIVAAIDRSVQRAAIACHASQSTGNDTLWRRLALQGDVEHFAWLRRSDPPLHGTFAPGASAGSRAT